MANSGVVIGQFVPEEMFAACGRVIGNTGTQFAVFVASRTAASGSLPTWIEFYQALDILSKPELVKLMKYLRTYCPKNPMLFPKLVLHYCLHAGKN